jgi:hypothetical protein
MKKLINEFRTLYYEEVFDFVHGEHCSSSDLKYVVEEVLDKINVKGVGVESLYNGRFVLTFYVEGDSTELMTYLANSYNHPPDIDLSFEYYS